MWNVFVAKLYLVNNAQNNDIRRLFLFYKDEQGKAGETKMSHEIAGEICIEKDASNGTYLLELFVRFFVIECGICSSKVCESRLYLA